MNTDEQLQGETSRTWLAGMAMAAIIQKGVIRGNLPTAEPATVEQMHEAAGAVAIGARVYADALLAELATTKGDQSSRIA